MTTRRTFPESPTAATGGVAFGIPEQVGAKTESNKMEYIGPHEMPRGITLLSIANPDGTETLGIRTGSAVIDVRAASRLLRITAPLTLEELLREGNAVGLANIAAASGSTRSSLHCTTRPISPTDGFSPTPERSYASA